MFALALGAGFALSVVLLPLADLGDYGWRISFVVSAALVLLVPVIARNLEETRRYAERRARARPPGRVREVVDAAYGNRFLLLGLAAFLTNIFSAPSSQLTNRYLTDAHDFSNSEVARVPRGHRRRAGYLGILLAGRLAESRGRRPVTMVGLLVATACQMVFFLAGDDPVLWIAPTIAIVAAASAGLAVGTLDAELFPTEVRGTSNGFLLVCGVAGSAVGLVLATQLATRSAAWGSRSRSAASPVARRGLPGPAAPESADVSSTTSARPRSEAAVAVSWRCTSTRRRRTSPPPCCTS